MCLICTVVRNPFRVIFQNLNQNEKETKLIAIQEFQNKEAKIATTKNQKRKKQSTKQKEIKCGIEKRKMQIPKQVSSQELNAFDENNYESTLFEGHTH